MPPGAPKKKTKEEELGLVKKGTTRELLPKKGGASPTHPLSSAGPQYNQKIEESRELPFDVIIEILLRLPVESLLRYKSVCKLWCAQIQETEFIRRHMISSGNVIHVYKENEQLREDLQTFDRFDTLDGLLVEKNKLTKIYCIWNPATKQMLQLPGPYKLVECMKLFYLPTTNNCKLVRAYGKEGDDKGGCQVLDFGTDLRWRYIDIPSFHNLASVGDRLHIMAINHVFFLCRFFPAGLVILAYFFLEIESGHSGIIKIPNAFFTCWSNVMPFKWEENKLELVELVGSELHFWTLEDYWNGRWARWKRSIPLTFLDNVPQNLYPKDLHEGVFFLHFGNGSLVWYGTKFRSLYVISSPPGKELRYSFIPSLVSLQGFRPQDKKQRGKSLKFWI